MAQLYNLCLVAKSCPTFATAWTIACQAPLSMGFSRQEYWCGLPFPSPYIILPTFSKDYCTVVIVVTGLMTLMLNEHWALTLVGDTFIIRITSLC